MGSFIKVEVALTLSYTWNNLHYLFVICRRLELLQHNFKAKLLRTTQYWMKKLKFALVHIHQDKVFQTIKFAEFHFSPANHSFLLCGFLFCCITGVLAFVSLREQTSKEKNLNIRVHLIIFVWVQGKNFSKVRQFVSKRSKESIVMSNGEIDVPLRVIMDTIWILQK